MLSANGVTVRFGKRILFRKEALDIYLSKKENDSLLESN